jgi:hypothetical protein
MTGSAGVSEAAPTGTRINERVTDMAALIRPCTVEAYIDVVQLRLQQKLSKEKLKRLRALRCGVKQFFDPIKFGPSFYPWRLRLFQPSDAALQFLIEIDGHLNFTEFALDWIFDHRDRKGFYRAGELMQTHFVKGHHRQQVQVLYKGITYYSGPRKAPTVFAGYADRPSKITGEVDCVHIEGRLRTKALRRAGIGSLADLLNFDHHAFWSKYLRLHTIDLRALGRLHLNSRLGTRRRQWQVSCGPARSWIFDKHLAAGSILFAVADRSIQKVVDRFGSKLRVQRCLAPMKVDHLLPANPTTASHSL